MTDTQAAQAGHNEPPVDYDALTERLRLSHAGLITRCNELVEAMDRVPEIFEDDATEKRASDYIKQLATFLKSAKALRVEEKEPYLEGGRRVDGFFKVLTDRVEDVKTKANGRLTAYQVKRQAAERERRKVEERIAREAAEQARQEAEAALAAAKDDADLAGAVDADEEAQRLAEDLAAAEKAAAAKAADLSRSRSDHGTVASLRTDWKHRNLDRATINLEALREHLPEAALDQAVRSFIKAGGRKLDGVEIYEHHEAQVR